MGLSNYNRECFLINFLEKSPLKHFKISLIYIRKAPYKSIENEEDKVVEEEFSPRNLFKNDPYNQRV